MKEQSVGVKHFLLAPNNVAQKECQDLTDTPESSHGRSSVALTEDLVLKYSTGRVIRSKNFGLFLSF